MSFSGPALLQRMWATLPAVSPLAWGIGISVFFHGALSVSYTHLDVYKRQVFTSCATKKPQPSSSKKNRPINGPRA